MARGKHTQKLLVLAAVALVLAAVALSLLQQEQKKQTVVFIPVHSEK